MVSRNLERANENDGFKMTALENSIVFDQAFYNLKMQGIMYVMFAYSWGA